MTHRPVMHLAIPVDDLAAARHFYGGVLGLPEGRSTDHWVDWSLEGHQLVTHLVPSVPQPAGTSLVEKHTVPVPHFGLLLDERRFHACVDRLRAAGVHFVIEPHLRFPGEPGEQWTMFFRDPAGNALEFKSFRDASMVFAR
ncbi:VOC family protein [Streptomyces marokkonensis]|uniref:VOC family protein n=1 Tax=Streptomyces marokkonensis TaxID=324855 RepID=A0ABW6QG22_9ACTN